MSSTELYCGTWHVINSWSSLLAIIIVTKIINGSVTTLEVPPPKKQPQSHARVCWARKVNKIITSHIILTMYFIV